MDNEVLTLIHQHFAQISEKELQEAIASVSKLYHFEAGTLIQSYGDYIRMIPLVVTGSIKVLREDEKGNELFLYHINSGETCTMAFSCCMRRKKSEIKTITETVTIVIGIPIGYMDSWMTKYPTWKNFVMSAYDQRMIELIYTLDSVAFTKMDERLLAYLEKKAKLLDTNIITITHQNIATDLNASREAISRLLKAMEKKGIVKLSRNKIQLL